jgi:hypothetical protein
VVESTPRRITPIKYSSFAQIRGANNNSSSTSNSVNSVKKEESTIFAAFGIGKKVK